jgi:hypothetical protein
MELTDKIVGLLVAVFAASFVAITVEYVAHYDFGLSRLDIRTSALMGAAIFALRKAAKIHKIGLTLSRNL